VEFCNMQALPLSLDELSDAPCYNKL